MSAREQLAAALLAEGGLLVGALAAPGAQPAPGLDVERLAAAAAAGPRAADAPDVYALVLAAVREGYRLHYGSGDVVRSDDRDLELLGGDRLYALALAGLADRGDLDAVIELADLISLCAQAHAGDEGERSGASALADAAWEAAAVAIGAGPSIAHTRAKERARAGEVDADAALRDAARARNLP